MRVRALAAALLVTSTTLFAACGDDDGSTEAEAPTSATAAKCEAGSLPLKVAGKLTIATDQPAYPPYFEDDDPTNGNGFESAVAYAIAGKLGIDKADVVWKVVPFNASFKPGSKDFDFDVNQVSITEPRKKAVDFSAPYFASPQAVLALSSSPAAKATSLEALRGTKFGVQVATTSLDAAQNAIAPSSAPQVFNDSNDLVAALKTGRIEAAVVDLPTAIYLANVELDNAVVVGQFGSAGGDEWGAVLEKGSELTPCVDQAITSLVADGSLDKLTKQWITDPAGARELG